MKTNTTTLHTRNNSKFRKPMAIGQMTRKQWDKELAKGIESIKDSKLYSADEVDAEFAREFGI